MKNSQRGGLIGFSIGKLRLIRQPGIESQVVGHFDRDDEGTDSLPAERDGRGFELLFFSFLP